VSIEFLYKRKHHDQESREELSNLKFSELSSQNIQHLYGKWDIHTEILRKNMRRETTRKT
jgi:hypothetical protein